MQASEAAGQLFALLDEACSQYPQHAHFPVAVVDVSQQVLRVFFDGEFINSYPVSTSRYGIGQDEGSYKTPIGVHCIREKIGADANIAEIFKARKRTYTQAAIEPEKISTDRDCVTSRILWLTGLEEGINKGSGVDSYARYIYIHGTPAEGHIGQPASEGCIRMKNQDVIELFELLPVASLVIVRA